MINKTDHRTVTGVQLFKGLVGGNKGPMYQAKWEDALLGAYKRGSQSAFFLGIFDAHFNLIHAGVRDVALMTILEEDKHVFDSWFRTRTTLPQNVHITLAYTERTARGYISLLLVRADKPSLLTDLLLFLNEEHTVDGAYHRRFGQLLGYGQDEIETFVERVSKPKDTPQISSSPPIYPDYHDLGQLLDGTIKWRHEAEHPDRSEQLLLACVDLVKRDATNKKKKRLRALWEILADCADHDPSVCVPAARLLVVANLRGKGAVSTAANIALEKLYNHMCIPPLRGNQ